MRGATALFAGTKVIRVVLRVTLLMGFLMLGTAQAQITIRVPADVSTIQGAINVAINGDTVLVAPGTYVENLNFFGKAITVESEAGPEVTIIDGNQSGTTVLMGPGGALLGFTITGGFATFGAGMAVSGSGSLIKDNIFDGNNESSGGFGAAIGGNGASPTIEQNVFRNNSCDNQFLAGVVSFVNTSSPRIFNNLFVDNPCRAINMTLPVGSQPEVFNNTMVRNRTGVRVDRRINTSAQIYRNNLIVANEIGLEVEFGTEAENPTWENNLVFNNGTDYGGIQNQTGISSNVSADPLLTDLEFGNFHLLPGSPAIDAGTNTHPNLPPTDIDGDARVFDGNGDSTAVIDIGADEFGFTDLTLSATGLNFGDQTLNTSSTPQSVTVTNTGAVALHLRVEASGDFSVFSTCRTPDGIAPADSCQVEVTFTPTATGPRDSTATLTSNANGSPHLIDLSGNGINPVPQLDSIVPGSALAGQGNFTLVATGSNFVADSVVRWNGTDRPTIFISANELNASISAGDVAAGALVAVTVFNPSPGGGVSNLLNFAIVDFSIRASPTSRTVDAGQSATYTLTVSPQFGSFSNAVMLACPGLPSGISCSFSSNPVTPGGSPSTSTLTISTSGGLAQLVRPLEPNQRLPILAVWLALLTLGLLCLPAKVGRQRPLLTVALATTLVALILLVGCGGGGMGPGTPSTTHNITVTATSGALQRSTIVSLVVH